MVRDFDQAFTLLSMVPPCEAFRIVTDGLTSTPETQPEVADQWLQLGHCINAILASMTVH